MVPDVVPQWFLQAGRSWWVWRWSEGWKAGTVAREQLSLYLWAVVTMGTRRNMAEMSSILTDQKTKPKTREQKQKKQNKTKSNTGRSKRLVSVSISLHHMHRISWRLSWGNPDYQQDYFSRTGSYTKWFMWAHWSPSEWQGKVPPFSTSEKGVGWLSNSITSSQ